MDGHVRYYKQGDDQYVAAHIRKEDREEVAARSGRTPLVAIQLGVMWSDSLYTVVGPSGNPAAVFGAGADGIVWLLGTDEIATKPLSTQFLRCSRVWVRHLHALGFPMLYNVVDARNTTHIRWLDWCGFTFIKRHEQYGLEQRPFLEFVRIQDV